jgi:hypothetical protein
MRDDTVALAQFNGFPCAKPSQEALGISQLTQSDRRHFRGWWHVMVAHCYDLSAAFWPPKA